MPWVTVMVMTIALLFAVYLNYIMPENVFTVIASLATFATVWVWIMILLSQIAFRRRLPPEEVKALKFKVPGGVTTTIVGLIFWSLSSRLSAIIRIPAFRCTLALRGLSCCWSAGDSSAVASANWLKHSNIFAG